MHQIETLVVLFVQYKLSFCAYSNCIIYLCVEKNKKEIPVDNMEGNLCASVAQSHQRFSTLPGAWAVRVNG